MALSRWKAKQKKRLAAAAIACKLMGRRHEYQGRRKRGSPYFPRQRQRRSVQSIYEMLGPYYFKRAFRMSYHSFLRLASKLRPFMTPRNVAKAHLNGPILSTVRLACALRYFAGGASYDIATSFGIGTSEVFESVWEVVDAINNFPGFVIEFPQSHEEQQRISIAFKNKSDAHFECCVGAVDGILIWLHRPSLACCLQAGCDAGKFFCGRKLKYGLNCQAICDADGRFLDLSILYPGSTADCLAFEGMAIYKKLEDGMLAPGLCLFGDNAYLNAPYMATPYSGGSVSTAKDAYNFYHSQLRIQIECAFGKFSQRWGILRSALPKNITVKKAVALVLALARLHNFCIDEKQSIENSTAQDVSHIEQDGGVPLELDVDADVMVPQQLLGGGEHFEGIDRNGRRRRLRRFNNIELPRARLLASVIDQDLRRPRPRVR